MLEFGVSQGGRKKNEEKTQLVKVCICCICNSINKLCCILYKETGKRRKSKDGISTLLPHRFYITQKNYPWILFQWVVWFTITLTRNDLCKIRSLVNFR